MKQAHFTNAKLYTWCGLIGFSDVDIHWPGQCWTWVRTHIPMSALVKVTCCVGSAENDEMEYFSVCVCVCVCVCAGPFICTTENPRTSFCHFHSVYGSDCLNETCNRVQVANICLTRFLLTMVWNKEMLCHHAFNFALEYALRRVYATYGERRGACGVLVWRPEGNRPLWSPRHRWE